VYGGEGVSELRVKKWIFSFISVILQKEELVKHAPFPRKKRKYSDRLKAIAGVFAKFTARV
jgi:hypothetical protein